MTVAGMHMLFDGVGDARLLNNAEMMLQLIIGVARVAKMKIVNGPTIHSFKEAGQPEAGLSSYAIIAESHIAIHTWPGSGEFSFDLYSCKPFDAAKVESYVALSLGLALTQFYRLLERPGRPSAPETVPVQALMGKES